MIEVLSIQDTISITQLSVILITLFILIWQTRQSVKQTKSLITNLEVNSIEMATNKMYKIFEFLINKPRLSKVAGRKYTSEGAFAALLIDLYCMIYEQYRRGLINEVDWKGWENSIRLSFQSEDFRKEWNEGRSTLPAYFVEAIEKKMSESKVQFR